MRTHYGPWQPCWISNQHQKHKSGREPSSEHFWQVWLISVQRFQRRRFKCEKLTDGRTDAYPWQKLTWPMARWAKNLTRHVFKYKHTKWSCWCITANLDYKNTMINRILCLGSSIQKFINMSDRRSPLKGRQHGFAHDSRRRSWN
jgi:hypothetical protein